MGTEKKTADQIPGTVLVTCKSADTIPLDKIIDFQGELKELNQKSYTKLKESILLHGITFPLSCWLSKNVYYDLDGHQRCKVLKRMRDEGYVIPDIPVTLVDAKDKKEARKKLLLASSSYADITPQSLNNFLKDSGIDFEEVEDLIKIPDLDMNAFRKQFYQEGIKADDEQGPDSDHEEATVEGMELLPSEHHDYIVILCDDHNDFQYLCDKFKIKKVNLPTEAGKKRVGVGRCVNGKKVIKDHFSNVK